jgi:hypothetical protein
MGRRASVRTLTLQRSPGVQYAVSELPREGKIMDEQMDPHTEAASGGIDSPLQGLYDRLADIRPMSPPPDPSMLFLPTGLVFSDISSGFGVWLRDWRTACLPPFIEGSHVHPPAPSWLAASVLGRGGFSYTGGIDATKDAKAVLSYTRWRSQLKLPAAPLDAWLLYRFRVQGGFSANFGGDTAVVWHTVNVGVAANSATMTPFLTGEYARTQEAGAYARGTMQDGVGRLAASGAVMIEGSVRVSKGDIPEIAILLSADLFLRWAWIDFMHAGPNHSWVSGIEYAGDGCIEYRYVSAALLQEFATARLTLRLP